jgi:hypothetical protein
MVNPVRRCHSSTPLRCGYLSTPSSSKCCLDPSVHGVEYAFVSTIQNEGVSDINFLDFDMCHVSRKPLEIQHFLSRKG